MRMRSSVQCLLSCLALGAEAGELTGRVTNDGRGVIGATVSAVPYESPYAAALRESRGGVPGPTVASVTTTADGRFRLSVPPTAPPFVVRVTFGGLASRNVDGSFEASDTDDLGEIVLRNGESVSGRVVDAAGKPVGGALVRLGRDGAVMATRADGLFRFDDVEGGGAGPVFGPVFGPASRTASLSIHAPGYELQAAAARYSAAPTVVTLRASAARLGGVLRDPSGRPAAEAVVRLTGDVTSRWVRTDAAGRFEISGVPSKQSRLEALARDGSSLQTALASGSANVSFSLARPAGIEGRITQSDNGRMVAGVKVSLRAGATSLVTRSSVDGRYRFTGLTQGAYAMKFDEKRFVIAERRGLELAAGETRTVDVALTPAVTLVGRVTDEDGKPVVGARGVVASGSESRMGLMLLRGIARGGDDPSGFVSGPDGSFKATRLAPGTNQRLTVTHPEFERRIIPGVDLVPGLPKPLSLDVVLSPGVSISGTVKDKDGRALSGASVSLSRSVRMQGGRGGNMLQIATIEAPRPAIETDEEGRFTFKGLSAGEYDLIVTKSGFTRNTTSALKAAEGMAPVEVTLLPGASIGGRVVQPNGAPVSGYSIAAMPSGTERLMMGSRGGFNAVSDPDGAFTIEGLTPGTTYDLELRAAGDFRGGQRKRDVVAPTSDLVLEVPARGRIAGRVLDAATNAPITEFEARYSPSMGGGGMVVVVRGGPGDGDRRTPFASPDGAFAFEDVPPGNWDVTVWAKTYQEARTSAVAVAAGETKTIEVKAARGLVIRGRVVDAKSGRGIPEASVSVRPAAGGGMFVFDTGGPGGELTDAEGRFEVAGQAPGAYQVTATHPLFSEGTARLTVEDRDAAIDVPLIPGGTIAGIVLSAQGAPLAGAEVSLQNGNDGGGMRFGFDGHAALTDAAGRFRFEHLAAGRYRVSASLRAEASTPIEVPLNAGDVREDIRVTLDTGAVVRGVVSGLGANERGALMVNAMGAQDYFASARTAADGTFEFAGVPAGTLTLRATAGDMVFGSSRTAVKEVVIPEGRAEVATEIVFQDGLSISGTVTRAGLPVAGARVSAFMGGAGRQASARADENGAFRIVGLEAGRVNLVAFAEGFESQVSQSVELQADMTVDLVIPTARISGVVVDAASGLPLESAVEMQRAAPVTGAPVGRMVLTTDSSGRFAFDNLDAVDFRLTARRSGYEAVTRTVRPADAGEELRLELKRGSGLAIEARDAQMGFGLRSVFLRVQEGANDSFMGPVALDGDGHGEIPGLPPGSYSLTAQASGYAPVRIPNVMVPSGILRLSFTPGGAVEFRSTENFLAGGTKAGQIVSLSGLPVGLGPGGPGSFRLSRLTQRVENLAPGRYRLTLDGGISKDFEITEGGVAIVNLP